MANEIMNNEVATAIENTAKAGSKKGLTIFGIAATMLLTTIGIVVAVTAKKKDANTENTDACDSDESNDESDDESVD